MIIITSNIPIMMKLRSKTRKRKKMGKGKRSQPKLDHLNK
jgi:hypothetical protein